VGTEKSGGYAKNHIVLKNGSDGLRVRAAAYFPGPMPETLRRPLLQAAFISLLLHGVLLLSVAYTLPLRLETAKARLYTVLSGNVRIAPLSKSELTPKTQPRPLASPPPEETVVHPLLADSSRKKAVKPAIAQAVPKVVSEVAAHPADIQPSPSLRPSVVPIGASVESSQGISADDLRHYRLSLAISARRFKRYPTLALEQGGEGTVEVALSFSARLPVPQIGLASSSGSRILDEQALEMVSQAAHATAIPESLKGRELRVVLPVKFSLAGD
jgi:periplasmic protein TonB